MRAGIRHWVGGEPEADAVLSSSPPVMCRLAWVAGFCIGPFGGNERTWKPFNPILGETFELDLPSNGVRFLAEQVQPIATELSVLPPQSARCVKSISWRLAVASRAETLYDFMQVSHHPPISAGHAENDKWVSDIVSAPSTKFMGNSVEIYPVGGSPHCMHREKTPAER